MMEEREFTSSLKGSRDVKTFNKVKFETFIEYSGTGGKFLEHCSSIMLHDLTFELFLGNRILLS